MPPQADLDADQFRQVLGHFCTGVTVITASGPQGPAGFAMETTLVKYDLPAGTTEEHRFGPGRTPGEGVFVPVSDDAREDDGYVLAYVHDAASDSSSLAILDASDFAASPVATVALPQRVPFGFHGSWVPDPGELHQPPLRQT